MSRKPSISHAKIYLTSIHQGMEPWRLQERSGEWRMVGGGAEAARALDQAFAHGDPLEVMSSGALRKAVADRIVAVINESHEHNDPGRLRRDFQALAEALVAEGPGDVE